MSLLPTAKLALQAYSKADQWETRMGTYGSWAKVFRDSSLPGGIVPQSLKDEANRSNGRVLQHNVLNFNDNVQLVSTRSVELSPVAESSERKTISFSKWGFTISSIPALHQSNEIAREAAFINSYRSGIRKLAVKLNELAQTYLDTNKATAINEPLNHTFDAGLDELLVANVDRGSILGDTSIIQNANDYYDRLDIVGNSQNQQLVNELREKGAFNTDDKTYQWNDKNFFFDHQMGTDAGYNAQFYAAPEGCTGVLIRQELDALMGHSSTDGKQFEVVYDDLLSMPLSCYKYSKVMNAADIHGVASMPHLERTLVELYDFTIEVGFVDPHNTVAGGPAPIIKISVANAV